jgi:hypothetical protein
MGDLRRANEGGNGGAKSAFADCIVGFRAPGRWLRGGRREIVRVWRRVWDRRLSRRAVETSGG